MRRAEQAKRSIVQAILDDYKLSLRRFSAAKKMQLEQFKAFFPLSNIIPAINEVLEEEWQREVKEAADREARKKKVLAMLAVLRPIVEKSDQPLLVAGTLRVTLQRTRSAVQKWGRCSPACFSPVAGPLKTTRQ